MERRAARRASLLRGARRQYSPDIIVPCDDTQTPGAAWLIDEVATMDLGSRASGVWILPPPNMGISVHTCAAGCFRMIPNSPFLLKRRKSGRSGSASPNHKSLSGKGESERPEAPIGIDIIYNDCALRSHGRPGSIQFETYAAFTAAGCRERKDRSAQAGKAVSEGAACSNPRCRSTDPHTDRRRPRRPVGAKTCPLGGRSMLHR